VEIKTGMKSDAFPLLFPGLFKLYTAKTNSCKKYLNLNSMRLRRGGNPALAFQLNLTLSYELLNAK